jgi:hypothetical protein
MCGTIQGYPNYIEESNKHKVDSKVQQVNKEKPMSIKNKSNKHAQSFISFKNIKKERGNEITTPKESKVLTHKPNPPHFSLWHKAPKGKGLSSNT